MSALNFPTREIFRAFYKKKWKLDVITIEKGNEKAQP
jgi:hypothetical protein